MQRSKLSYATASFSTRSKKITLFIFSVVTGKYLRFIWLYLWDILHIHLIFNDNKWGAVFVYCVLELLEQQPITDTD